MAGGSGTGVGVGVAKKDGSPQADRIREKRSGKNSVLEWRVMGIFSGKERRDKIIIRGRTRNVTFMSRHI